MQPRKHESEAPTVSASRVGDAFRSSSGRFGEPRVPSASATPPLDTLHKRRILPFSMYIRSRHIRYVRRVSSDVFWTLLFSLSSSILFQLSLLSPFYFLPPLSLLSAVVRANASFEYMHTCLRVYVRARDAYHLIPSCGSRHSPHAR